MAKKRMSDIQVSEMIIAYLGERFASGERQVRMNDVIPGLGELAICVNEMWLKFQNDKASIGVEQYELFETINCLWMNLEEEIPRDQVTNFGTIGEESIRLSGAVAKLPKP